MSERLAAYLGLLAIPDPDDLWRSHRLTVEGRSDRFQQWKDLRLGHPVITRVQQEERYERQA